MLDKPEWKLLGQQLTITLPITDISSVNHDIHSILMISCGSLTITIVVTFSDANTLFFICTTNE